MSSLHDFKIEDGVLKKYIGADSAVVIPDSVTSIGREAFIYNKKLTSVTIPDSVTSIGDRAFNDCINLTSVTIPDSVTDIGCGAFDACSNLTNVKIPAGVTCIENCTFELCDNLTSVTIPDSVRWIGRKAFSNCTELKDITLPEGIIEIEDAAFMFCNKLENLTIPASVEGIGDHAFFNVKTVTFKQLVPHFSLKWFNTQLGEFRIIFPADAFITTQRLESDYCKTDINPSIKELAFLLLYQKGNIWKTWLLKKTRGSEVSVFSYMIDQFAADENAPADSIAEYIANNSRKLKPETIELAIGLLKDRKYKGLSILTNDPDIKRILSSNSISEHPMESYVNKMLRKFNPDPRILLDIKEGIHYVEPKMLCSRNVLAFVIARYARKMKLDKKGNPALSNGDKLPFDKDADYVAASLDREELSMLLTRLVEKSYKLYLLPWARYTLDDPIGRLMSGHIAMSRGKAKLDSRGSNFYEALMLSDTVNAMKMFDKYGDLERYANMRGKTAMEIRDSILLPGFGFEADGIKRYDIGGNIIEVSIAPDMSCKLFDVNKQKEIRSIPKNSDDPAKAEVCAKDYATFKKEMLAFAKQRTELLHKMHMSGEWLKQDLWCKVYIEHPLIRHLGQLVVWQDEVGKTFMIVNNTPIDAQDNMYEPQGKIRVAHVLDMNAVDIAAWQQWLVEHKCVQLFEQVWEPVMKWDMDSITDRYMNAEMDIDQRNAVKKALKLRGVDMRADEWSVMFERDVDHNRSYFAGYGSSNDMLFGDSIKILYAVNEQTKTTTFKNTSICSVSKPREINAILLELDKATLSLQITHDNDAILTSDILSKFTAAQITNFINVAISSNATRCTAFLLNYKHEHFPKYSEMNEFSLDW